MSVSVPIQAGVYEIFNVQYPNQDADLIAPGGVSSYIGGWENNNRTKRMQWRVTNIRVVDKPFVGKVIFLNQELQTYAALAQSGESGPGMPLIGDPDSAVEWTVTVAPNSGGSTQYVISLYNSPYVWTLQGGYDGAPITMQLPGANPQLNQLWTFVKVE